MSAFRLDVWDGGKWVGGGSCAALASDTGNAHLLVTCRHNLPRDSGELAIRPYDRPYSRSVSVLGVSREYDLAILECETGAKGYRLAGRSPADGESATIVGFPHFHRPWTAMGRFARPNGILRVDVLPGHTKPGFSGAPVLNRFGELVGIHCRSTRSAAYFERAWAVEHLLAETFGGGVVKPPERNCKALATIDSLREQDRENIAARERGRRA